MLLLTKGVRLEELEAFGNDGGLADKQIDRIGVGRARFIRVGLQRVHDDNPAVLGGTEFGWQRTALRLHLLPHGGAHLLKGQDVGLAGFALIDDIDGVDGFVTHLPVGEVVADILLHALWQLHRKAIVGGEGAGAGAGLRAGGKGHHAENSNAKRKQFTKNAHINTPFCWISNDDVNSKVARALHVDHPALLFPF